MEEKKTSGVVIGLAAAVLGVAVGFGAATLVANNAKQETAKPSAAAPSTDTKAATLRVSLNALLRENVNLTGAAARAAFDGSPDAPAALAQLEKNSKDIQGIITGIYGEEAGKKFYDLWNSHASFLVNYASAIKANKKADIDTATNDLTGFIESFSTFLSETNPNFSKADAAKLTDERVSLAKIAIDFHSAKNYTESYSSEHSASTAMSKFADALADAIVKHHKEKF